MKYLYLSEFQFLLMVKFYSYHSFPIICFISISVELFFVQTNSNNNNKKCRMYKKLFHVLLSFLFSMGDLNIVVFFPYCIFKNNGCINFLKDNRISYTEFVKIRSLPKLSCFQHFLKTF